MFTSFAELSRGLGHRNHEFLDVCEADEHPTNVWPRESLIVTIAVEDDCVLRPNYRSNYFTCFLDGQIRYASTETRAIVDRVIGDACKRSGLWDGEVEFLNGPARWLLLKLLPLHVVYLWPDRYTATPVKDAWTFLDWELESARVSWRSFIATNASVQKGEPVRLELSTPSGVNTLLEAAVNVAEAGRDIYVTDETLDVVYLLHHHNKIVLSCSDLQVQRSVVADLRSQPECFEDHSNFQCSSDGELFSDAE